MSDKAGLPVNLTKGEVSDLKNLIEEQERTAIQLYGAERAAQRAKDDVERYLLRLQHNREQQ